jgi:hypothetical protein
LFCRIEADVDRYQTCIDKAGGIRKPATYWVLLRKMTYIGDALHVGGNDYSAKQQGWIAFQLRILTRQVGYSNNCVPAVSDQAA